MYRANLNVLLTHARRLNSYPFGHVNSWNWLVQTFYRDTRQVVGSGVHGASGYLNWRRPSLVR